MSSEGSVSSNGSRIRQFGLYRTIDSRTEDFLRSSRKRQIRQGCACAAISTAITVTVVVSVILVYEYSINSGANINKKTSLKPNWIALMNDSDITSISSKFNKKINFDRTTLKLLPILLKALNKNRYLEKILEDYSSSPPYAGTDSTEATFTRNVFSDSKNWLKLPTTRHYMTDYKTSPLMQWRTPTHRLDYLTKIRKIRDYQRMLNYFDKMINDKVGVYQKREFEYFTESPMTAETVPMTKIDKYRNIQRLRNVSPTGKDGNPVDNSVGCSCPLKLGLLLGKLIGALQDLIPHIIVSKTSQDDQDMPNKNTTKLIESLEQLTTARTVRPTKQHFYDNFSTIAYAKQKPIKNKQQVTLTNRKCCSTSTTSMGTTSQTEGTATKTSTSTATKTSASTAIKTTASTAAKTTAVTAAQTTTAVRITTTSSTTNLAAKTTKSPAQNEFRNHVLQDNNIQTSAIKIRKLPNYQIFEETTSDYDLPTKPTKTPNIQTAERVEIKLRTTEAIVPVKFITELSTEKWLKPYNMDSFYPKVTIPMFKEEDYDEYFNNKPSKANNEFENLDVHSKEFSKTKTTYSGEDMELGKGDNKINFKGTTDDVKPKTYHTVTMQDDVDLTSMRKLADMLYLPQDHTDKVLKYTIEPEVSTKPYTKIKYPGTQTASTTTNSIENSVDPTTSIILTNSVAHYIDPTISTVTNSVENAVGNPTTRITFPSLRKTIKIVDSAPDVKNYHYDAASKYQPNSLIQNEQQIIENMVDDELQEEYMRPTEGSRVPYIYKKKYTILETTKSPEPWEFTKKDEKIANLASKSMLPALRPIYLEIQRNTEWKPEEHADYDIYNFNNNIFDLPNIN